MRVAWTAEYSFAAMPRKPGDTLEKYAMELDMAIMLYGERGYRDGEIKRRITRQFALTGRRAGEILYKAKKIVHAEGGEDIVITRARKLAMFTRTIQTCSTEIDLAREMVDDPEHPGRKKYRIEDAEERTRIVARMEQVRKNAASEILRIYGGYAPSKVHVALGPATEKQGEFLTTAAALMGLPEDVKEPAHRALGDFLRSAAGGNGTNGAAEGNGAGGGPAE